MTVLDQQTDRTSDKKAWCGIILWERTKSTYSCQDCSQCSTTVTAFVPPPAPPPPPFPVVKSVVLRWALPSLFFFPLWSLLNHEQNCYDLFVAEDISLLFFACSWSICIVFENFSIGNILLFFKKKKKKGDKWKWYCSECCILTEVYIMLKIVGFAPAMQCDRDVWAWLCRQWSSTCFSCCQGGGCVVWPLSL